MSNKHFTEEIAQPHPDVTMGLRIVIDQTLHNFSKRERAFWALMYTKSQYNKIDEPEYDWVDFQIAVDETMNAAEKSDEDNASSIGEQHE